MSTMYSSHIEVTMSSFFRSLPERQRRLYAAVEAKKLGYGGISSISKLFLMSRSTIKRGLDELSIQEKGVSIPFERQRIEGGGRKKNGSIS